jgi:uncharacterized protein (DUF433 family)
MRKLLNSPKYKIVNTAQPNIRSFTTMILQDLKQQLLSLNPEEKMQVIQLLAQSLGGKWQGIEKIPKFCGGEACIAKTRIPVWVLVESRHLGYSDADFLTSYPTITATDLANAWLYAESHINEIELVIKRNEVA